ncbi:MAG: dTDP-4-dehydrorhamnose 3,5-epimerase [Pyrinomonadaceae bacterium]|jgi:dTDP-4-dehydrorhamnose 3,5-epimerase|nr:dTDP-4-dehydrorhamnose 3,5-epimerase [Pyrinomonadaceae bacterium]
MIFRETKILGVYVIEPEKIKDERGFFTHTWSRNEFAKQGLEAEIIESNVSFNRKEGTLRGMHYQAEPHGQTKLVRCTRGKVYDVTVDIRPGSPTFKQWFGIELSDRNHLMLYVPKELAHGYQTLLADTEVLYQVSSSGYVPQAGRGVRWNDPAFGIEWPDVGRRVVIERDQNYQDFKL